MNERVMQFRIGMFVIVAGLVLTMLIVWFGESPALLRDQAYLRARYAEAPGVLEGVAVRKSGIRVGEVVAIAFDERPGQPDGVLVTLAIERKYSIRKGSVPRLSRSLIGDVSIDLLPGTGEGAMELGRKPADAPVVEGEVSVDPGKALAAATQAFDQAGDTLRSINEAATGLAKITRSADKVDEFLKTWTDTGRDVSSAGKGISTFIKDNEGDFRAAVADIRKVGDKLNETLGPETQDAVKTGVAKFSSASARLDGVLAEFSPVSKDLGAPASHAPTTDVGQAVRRINRVAADLELLSGALRNRQGTLNTDGTIQKLLTQAEIYENYNAMAINATQALNQFKTILATLRAFAERVSRDPSALSRGMLQR
ncbi:mce related protein [Aquisphaera giovannonii]|uniref:Mce related protein n=1 Tax=Aquisphaera giovannonii TaxID=406548 RepID=A0A5B9W2U7_9BACT|nr:MlaD family protein [Aquisphaera giovannonii]QEH34411.1 mce related protein [Aquisphaera giovannonii]